MGSYRPDIVDGRSVDRNGGIMSLGRTLTATCLAGTLIGSLIPAAAHAAPDAGVPLALTSVEDVVATNSRVFVSGGRTSTEVAVHDAAGAPVTTLADLPGPTDLLLSRNSRTLWVALSGSGDIAAFDTRTLREVARYDTGVECVESLAQAGRWLFFGYGCDGRWGGSIGRLDLRAPTVDVRTGLASPLSHGFYGTPMLTAPRNNPRVLIAGQLSLIPGRTYVYAVAADGTLNVTLESDNGAPGSSLTDIATTPDGATVFTATGAPNMVREFAVGDFETPLRTYDVDSHAPAVELSRDGRFVAAGADEWNDDEVFVFNRDGTVVTSYQIGTRRATLIRRGLTWSPDGNRLYAVAFELFASPPAAPTLHVLAPRG